MQGKSSGGAMGNDEEMDVNDTPWWFGNIACTTLAKQDDRIRAPRRMSMWGVEM